MLVPGDFRFLWRTARSFRFISLPVVTNTSQYSFTVAWEMSDVCSAYVEYGTATGTYTDQTVEQSIAGNYSAHTQDVTSLMPNTTYYWRTVSTDGDGTIVTSDEYTTTTDALAGVIDFPTSETLAYHSLVTTTMPAYLSEVTDGSTGNQVIRISQIKNQRNRYSTKAAWSANERYLFLDYGSTNRALLDGTTYAVLQSDINSQGQFTWSAVDDNLGFAWSGNSILRYTITDSSYSYVTDATIAGWTETNLGGGDGSTTDDGRYMALGLKSGTSYGVGVYDTQTKALSASITLPGEVSGCKMSSSGAYVIVQGFSTGTGYHQGTWCYEADLNTSTRYQISTGMSHCDTCRDPSDTFDQLIIGGDTSPFGLTSVRLSTGVRTNLTGYFNRYHVSCRSVKRPGYAYVSSYSVPGEGGNYSWAGYGEVYAVKTDGSLYAQGERFAQQHHVLSLGYTGYPMASVSPRGDRVIWASEWSNTGGISDGVYCFVAGVNV